MTGFDGSGLLERLGEAAQDLRGKLRPNTSLAELTWFRVGGPAELFFAPQDVADLQLFLRLLPIDVPVTVLGLASNTLVRDGGIPGAVVKLSGKPFTSCELDGTRLSVGSGLAVKRLASVALRACIGGMHFFHGIPGSLGGALRMNAGANGIETADCVYSVDAVDRNGDRLTLTKAQMGFSYRHSSPPDDVIFVGAVLEGTVTSQDQIEAAMAQVQAHREEHQPIRERTSGSTFKNPEGTSAWKLVDQAGMRGFSVGGAQMSEKHCNFMINTGDATASDLELLGETVRERVFRQTGTLLEWEVARVGQHVVGAEITPFQP